MASKMVVNLEFVFIPIKYLSSNDQNDLGVSIFEDNFQLTLLYFLKFRIKWA